MNEVKVLKAVYARLVADTGTGGLFNADLPLVKAAYIINGPATAKENPSGFPYVVARIADIDALTAFRKEIYQPLIRFDIFVPKTLVAAAGYNEPDPFERMSKIIDRIYGDAAASSWTPTYGFHRHTLSVDGDWDGSVMLWEPPQIVVPEHDMLHYVQQYKLLVSR